jgi:uncharacterized protein (TIGR00369 family)
MADTDRQGPFWDLLEGRVAPPPVAALLGWKLVAVDPERGTIRLEFAAKSDFLNPAGVIQGGILGAMLDDTMGPAAVAFLGGRHFAQTLELKTNFIRAARPGRLFGDAKVVHRGRDILFLEGALSDEAGKLIATATATARIVDFPGAG